MKLCGEGNVPRSRVVKCETLALSLWVLLNVESLSWAGASKVTIWRLEGRPIADQLLGSSNQHPDPYLGLPGKG